MSVVIDADGTILGRLAVQAAEALKDGKEVAIINAEKAVITGRREEVFERYRKRRNTGSREKGPFFPKAPDRIVKRTIRGMLPKNKQGREAFKRLRTYKGNPENLETGVDTGIKTVQDLKGRNYVSLGEVSANM